MRAPHVQTGSLDLLTVVAAVIMVTEEDTRKISNLHSPEIC